MTGRIALLLLFNLFMPAPVAAQARPLDLLGEAPALRADQDIVALRPDTLRGRAVIVTFFASWCPPCTSEFDELEEVRRRFSGQELAIVGVNLFENFGGAADPGRMNRFLRRTSPRFPLVAGDPAVARAFGGISRIPTMIVYDRSGREVWRFVHVKDSAKTHATAGEISEALEQAGLTPMER